MRNIAKDEVCIGRKTIKNGTKLAPSIVLIRLHFLTIGVYYFLILI